MPIRGLLYAARSDDYESIAVLDELIDVLEMHGSPQNEDYWLMAGSTVLDTPETPLPATASYIIPSQEDGSSPKARTPPLTDGPLPLLEYLADQSEKDVRSAAEGGILFLAVAGELPIGLYEGFKKLGAPDKRLFLDLPQSEWPASDGSSVRIADYRAFPQELRLTKQFSYASSR